DTYRRHPAGTMASDNITNHDVLFFIHPPLSNATRMVAIRTAGILPAQWLLIILPIPTFSSFGQLWFGLLC
ncbi:MAG: hypothetical protein ACLFUS_16500, partial [Candidatus Sumerlaeia bacterium]